MSRPTIGEDSLKPRVPFRALGFGVELYGPKGTTDLRITAHGPEEDRDLIAEQSVCEELLAKLKGTLRVLRSRSRAESGYKGKDR